MAEILNMITKKNRKMLAKGKRLVAVVLKFDPAIMKIITPYICLAVRIHGSLLHICHKIDLFSEFDHKHWSQGF